MNLKKQVKNWETNYNILKEKDIGQNEIGEIKAQNKRLNVENQRLKEERNHMIDVIEEKEMN